MILLKKAIRSIWENKKAYFSCVTLIIISVFTYASMGGASIALSEGAANYYKTNRLADAFAKVRSMGQTDIDALSGLDGVNEVLPRITYDARVLLPDQSLTIYLRLISDDRSYEGVPLNAYSFAGESPEAFDDIMIGASFLETHDLKPGDGISLLVEGKEVTFTIAGAAMSPEYVYAIKDINEIYPDKETFSIAYVDLNYLSTLLGKANEYNDLSFSFENGVSFDDMKGSLEEELEPYGLIELLPQKDQLSVSMLDSEIKSIGSMSTVIPFLFSSMSAIVLFLMLKRVIEQERTQIGTIKAFGYSNAEILLHYVFYGIFAGGIGGVFGLFLSNLAIGPLIQLYSDFFTLPQVSTAIPAVLAVNGFCFAVISSAIGAYAGARPALNLQPAEAMRPPSPPPIKYDIMKTFALLRAFLTSRGIMAVRNIMRAKARASFVALGIMFSFGMLAVVSSMMDIVSVIMVDKFTRVQTFDARLYLISPVDSEQAEKELSGINGVYIAEGIFEIPAELRSANLTKGTFLTGVKSDSSLYRMYDDKEKVIKPLTKDGLTLTQYLADKLRVGVGDPVYVKTAYNDDEIKIMVNGVVSQNMTQNCYMEINSLRDMLFLPDVANSVIIKTEDLDGLNAYMSDAKNVSSTEDSKRTVQNYLELLGSMNSMIVILTALSASIAFAVIYNTSSISLSERKREYATLRVLGLQVNEVCEILNFEYWTLFIFGTILGIPFTKLLNNLMNEMVKAQMDTMSLPADISLKGYLTAFIGCMAAVYFSNLSAKSSIKKFDMVEVLKERE